MKLTSTKIVVITLMIAAGLFAYFSLTTNIDTVKDLVVSDKIVGRIVAIEDYGLAVGLKGEEVGALFSYTKEDIDQVTQEIDGIISEANYSDIDLNDEVEVFKENDSLILRILEANE